MRYLTALVMLIGLDAAPVSAKAHASCPTEMYQRADASLVGAARSWGALSRHHRTFVSCDDGALAEGYSEAVVTMLADRWEQLDGLVALSGRDVTFRKWAIRHIDATASTDDLKKVVRNATRCNGPNAKTLCREIGSAARNALKENNYLRRLP